MEFNWLEMEEYDTVAVFVMGWAAGWEELMHLIPDGRSVPEIIPDGCDVVAVYDYRDSTLIGSGSYADRLRHTAAEHLEMLSGYKHKYLFAWSFGVWVAEQITDGMTFDRAVAFNGTPLPVNHIYGIEPRRMEITVAGLQKGGMEAFNRRTYGSYYEQFSDVLSPRTLEENIRELADLQAGVLADPRPSIAYLPSAMDAFRWDKAIVGADDMIFPPENMKRYWGSRAEVLPLPHFPFGDAEIIRREFGNR